MKKSGLTHVVSAVRFANQTEEHKDVEAGNPVNKKEHAPLKSEGGIVSDEDSLSPVYRSEASISGKSVANAITSGPRSQEEQTPDPEDPQSKRKEQKTKATDRRKSGRAPEQQLTRLALQLGVLEKTASQLGVLAFVWATVVLLGGFIVAIRPYDFWVVSAILITEGARVFSRSHELEWEHAAARSISIHDRVIKIGSKVFINSSKAFRETKEALRSFLQRWSVQLKQDKIKPQPQIVRPKVLPGGNSKRTWSLVAISLFLLEKLLDARRISALLYYLQLLSAGVCIGLSVSRLINQKFYSNVDPFLNLRPALLIFYSLALAEASVFLIERGYWEYEINFRKLLLKVHSSCHLHKSDLIMVKQFFYDVYSTCLNGSVFNGLDMDLVEYSIEKLHSDIATEQVGSVRILAVLADQDEFADDAMRRLETTPAVLPRLLEMITWKKEEENEIRLAAARIIRLLAHHDSNRFRIVAIPGALEGITSLLVSEKKGVERVKAHEKELDFKELKLLGLRILKNLAEEYTNRPRIGGIHGLLPMIVSYIEVENRPEISPEDDQIDINILIKSLQVLRLLSTATGLSGKALREIIAEAVFLLGYLRDILNFGGSEDLEPILQEYAVDILTSLALDETLKENIGRTGGIISSLLTLLLSPESEGDGRKRALRVRAGETLKLLVLQHSKNCHRLLTVRGFSDGIGQSNILKRLTELFQQDSELGICAVKIVRSVCKYNVSEAERAHIAALAPSLLEKTLQETGKMQEATLGLVSRIVSLLQAHEYNDMFAQEFDRRALLAKLMSFIGNLKLSTKLPKIRRHTLELVTALMTQDEFFLDEFKNADLETHLQTILETTSEVENFYTFSGTLGLNRHTQTMEELVEIARMQLRRYRDRENDIRKTE
ncbi:hypothetical protein O6H91_09G101200 [Diphasiastrum complanatum]|uniref:Uncharacterized protein n=4 Tax=Diphasiastrum complanatum TaxID=34168 RepID=A0ACC2CSH3_DIPCM|nr:hypothetical protein O6H91_09G101200 [Diphasiastrum complanatum]KAJ7544975.1 hypothetical protein O6H91_09G101200 [Diphasiastrum complanatum]KAJ7544976.1 hypothetical protein O6H91_09G101200 [Diphasiastrum complanatum]